MTSSHGIIASGERLHFGLVPMRDSDGVRGRLGDFCRLLGKAVDASILPHLAPSPSSLASAIAQGRVQLAWLSPTLLVTSPHVLGVTPLASAVHAGQEAYHTAVFVDESGPIQSVGELSGKRAAWVARTSASGYLFPRIALARYGLDLHTLFTSEIFVESHGAVAEAVFTGRADVGATFVSFEGGDPSRRLVRAGWDDVIPGKRARVLDVSGPIPADVIVAAPSVSATLRGRLTVALQRLDADAAGRDAMAQLFNAEAFRPVSPSALQALRNLITNGRSFGP